LPAGPRERSERQWSAHLTMISHPQVVATAIDELGARAHLRY
jgi:hypothetical protein